MRNYYVFDKTARKFCARKVSSVEDTIKKGDIVGHESEPCPRCAFSSRAFAVRAAMSAAQLCQIERGCVTPSIAMAKRLADAMGVPVAELMN